MAKDANGNEIPGSEETPGQESSSPDNKITELEKQIADLIAANKKQTADYEVMKEESQRLQQMLVSMREHPGDPSGEMRRSQPRGQGRFSDPGSRSEFERKYSLPADAADEIVDEAVSRMTRAQIEREEALRQQDSIRKSFFDEYPDLKDYVPTVKYFADQCANEHPNWTVKQGFNEVAKLSRQYIKSKLSTSSGREEPPEILSGGNHRSDGGNSGGERLPGSETPRMPTQEEEIKAEVESRSKSRSKAL